LTRVWRRVHASMSVAVSHRDVRGEDCGFAARPIVVRLVTSAGQSVEIGRQDATKLGFLPL
jgi:hypothetical protein